jgi:Tripartite tricarboxylate transporter family receptor
VAAPAGTPRPVVDKLHAEIVKAIRNPDTEKRLQQYAIKSIASSPEEFVAAMEKDTERLGEVVKASGARVD